MKQSFLSLFFVLYCLTSFGQSSESNRIFARGVELYNQNKYKAAISEFKRCQELDDVEMDSLDFRKEYTKEWIAHCYYKLSDIERANALGVQDFDIVPIDRTQTTESDSIISLAHIISSNGNISYAITKLKEGLELEINQLGSNNHAVANTHAMLATMYAGCNNLEQAESELALAKQIYQDQGYDNSYAYGTLLLREAYINLKKENKTNYLDLAKEALHIFAKWENAKYTELIDTYYLLALGNNTPAPNKEGENYLLKLLVQLLQISELEINGYAEQIILCCQGLIYFQHNNEALNLISKSIDSVVRYNLPNGNNQFYISLLLARSNLYKSINRLEDALSDAKQVISICENTMFFDKNQLDDVFIQLADIYNSLNEPQLQLQAAKEGYRRATLRTDDRTLTKATAKSYMAGANNLLEKKKEAFDDIQETMTLYQQLNLSETGYYAAGLSLRAEIVQNSNPLLAIEDCRKSAALYLEQVPIQYDRLTYVRLLLFQLLKKQSLDDEANHVLEEIEATTNNTSIPNNVRERILITFFNAKGNMDAVDNPDMALSYYRKAKDIAAKVEGSDIFSIDINIAMCLARSAKLNDATLIIDSLITALKPQTNKRLQYLNALGSASFVYGSKGDVANMKRFQDEAKKMCMEIYGSNSNSYAGFLTSTAYQLLQLGLAAEAYPLCKEAEKKMMNFFNEDDIEMIPLNTCMQAVELSLGNIDNAIKYGEKAKATAKKHNLQMILCEVLCNLSNCYREKCQYNEAVNLLNEAMSIAEKNDGRFNMRCASIFLQLAMVSQAMGNYSEARTYNGCYYEISKRIADKTQPQYAIALMYEANLEFEKGNIENAKELSNTALNILSNSLGENNAMTLEAKATTVQLLIQQGNISEAIIELEKIYNTQKKQNRFYDLSIMNLLATSYGMNKQFKKQINIADKILDVVKFKYGKQSQQVGNVYLHFANAYLGLGNYHKSADYSERAFNICRNTVLNNFLFMTKKERADLWNSVSTYFMVTLPTTCASVDNHTDFSRIAYNAALLSKGLLLQAETNISDIIYSSNNDNLKSEYNHFLYTKNLYNNATSSYSTDVELDELFKNKAIIDSLENEVNVLEHALMKHISSEFGDYTSNLSTTWSDVSQSLGQSDIAIEFLNATWKPDSIEYFALVLTTDAKAPTYIKLLSDTEIGEYHDFKSLTLEQMKDFSRILWQPIFSLYPNAKNIYFSPCGELYNIPIESLPAYNNESYLSDSYNFYRLSSTREISARYKHWVGNNISLYGDVKYDASMEELSTNDQKYKDNTVRSIEFENGGQDRGLITLNPLPGTAKEVESIASLVDSSQSLSMASPPFIGLEASEASVKSLSGRGDRVLHIATHGFYFPESKVTSSKYLQSIFSIEDKGGVVTYDSPEDAALLRCGLYMAGAKSSLQGKKAAGIDDGILTAREISMINLKGLDLAILSACETGIGDISGEGVFGLQRGFKKAGTHSILMSLWKVDDNATSYMMKEFYGSWLSGSTKQAALEFAKKQVRSHPEWNSPKYWSAFVLLDGINN